MAATEEGWHTAKDGKKLYTKTWKPDGPPLASLVFIHGFSDHCNTSYGPFFDKLAARSIQVHSFDQRGWGRSVQKPAEKGLTGPTTQVLADITSFIESHLPAEAPLFLMGHSMGGGEVLQYAARGPPEVRKNIVGYLASAPLVAVADGSKPLKITVVAGRLAAKLFPHAQMVQKLDGEYLCRDKQVVQDWENDPLCHNTGTLEGLAGMLERGDELDTGKVMPEDCKIWLGHGNADRVTSFRASERFIGRLGVTDKEFRVYDGCYHVLHAEPGEDRVMFANDVGNWILARAGSQAEPPTEALGAKSRL